MIKNRTTNALKTTFNDENNVESSDTNRTGGESSSGSTRSLLSDQTNSANARESGNHSVPIACKNLKKFVKEYLKMEKDAKRKKTRQGKWEGGKRQRQRKASMKEYESKIVAFLPARHVWTWNGPMESGGTDGKCRKTFYKSIQQGSDVINVGDCAVFLSTSRPDRPFIGRVLSFWANRLNGMFVKVAWFYHPEETCGALGNFQFPGAVFESSHTDVNDVQTISHKCEVVSISDFAARVSRRELDVNSVYENKEVYYSAGVYDPRNSRITYEPAALVGL